MNRTVAYCILVVATGAVIALSASAPTTLGDQNRFLRDFVNHEFLNVLGIILAITLASIGQLHLEFNKIEERYKQRGGLAKSRSGVRKAGYWLVGLFVAAVAVVVVKPIVPQTAEWTSIFNGAALIVLLWNILILVSILQTVFKIEPDIPE